jgi:hypothetical protein
MMARTLASKGRFIVQSTSHRRSGWRLYVLLGLALVGCLWIGWRDYDPRIPQEVVRESIRSTIRRVVQISVQYVIPGAIVVFFGQEAIARLRNNPRAGRPSG